MSTQRRISGFVKWLRCKACDAEFPVFVFSGDTDMETQGLRSLTDYKTCALVIAESDNLNQLLEQIGHVNNWKEALFATSNREGSSAIGSSFIHFLNERRRPEVYYRCVVCNEPTATLAKEMPLTQFRSLGFKVHLDDSLILDADAPT